MRLVKPVYPLCAPTAATLGGRIRACPEEFVVEELHDELPEQCPEGEYLWLHIEKTDLASDACVEQLARHFGLAPAAIGYAGRKDKAAVTRQWFSVACKSDSPVPAVRLGSLSTDGAGPSVLDYRRADEPLRLGAHTANRFEIVVRDCRPASEDLVGAAALHRERLLKDGLANAFGGQRFGHEGSTLKTGTRLLAGERLRIRRRQRQLSYNAVQAALFNSYLQLRLQRYPGTAAIAGDVLVNWRSGLQRWAEGGEDRAALEKTFEFVAGPLFGVRMRRAKLAALSLEQEVLAAAQVDSAVFEGNDFSRLAPGARRRIRVVPQNLDFAVLTPPAAAESVCCRFTLPPGSFATILLQQIMGGAVPPG